MKDQYDNDCLSIVTGVKAIWLLYRRGAWSSMSQLDLSRSQLEPQLERFDDEHVTTERGMIRTEEQARELINFLDPESREAVLAAAFSLNIQYQALYIEEVKSNAKKETRQRKRRSRRKAS